MFIPAYANLIRHDTADSQNSSIYMDRSISENIWLADWSPYEEPSFNLFRSEYTIYRSSHIARTLGENDKSVS